MRKVLFGAVVVAFVGLGAWAGYRLYGVAPAPSSDAPYELPKLTKSYRNAAYGFSLRMPDDFSAQELHDEFGDTVLLQNDKGEGIQILISPFDEDAGGYTLTEERIRQDISDILISEAQPVEVGNNYKGLAFKSDNDAFGGASREVWFVFNGSLYQISTYERFDPLLKAIFGTWNFE